MLNAIRAKYHPLWRLRQFEWYRNLQLAVDPDFAIGLNGCTVYVKLLRDLSLILPHRGQEAVTKSVFSSLLSRYEVDVFFDVGANVGMYSWIAKECNVRDIFMFEPDQTNCRLLMRTLQSNSLEHVFLVPFAASATAGVSSFFPDKASGATGSLEINPHSLHLAYGVGESTAVPTLPLDLFAGFCLHKRVLIKIDVEGAEEAVIAGAMNLIQQNWPLIIIECFSESRLDSLRSLGYSVTSLEESHNYLLVPPDSLICS